MLIGGSKWGKRKAKVHARNIRLTSNYILRIHRNKVIFKNLENVLSCKFTVK